MNEKKQYTKEDFRKGITVLDKSLQNSMYQVKSKNGKNSSSTEVKNKNGK